MMSSSSSSSSSASLPCGTSTGNDVVSLYTKGRARALIYSPELTGLPRQAITAVALCSRAPHAPQPTRQYKCKRCGDLGHQQGGCSATPLAGWVAPPPRKRKEQKDPKPAKTKAKRKSTELDAPREADPEEDERDDQPDEDDEELHLDPIVQAERDVPAWGIL